jgi:hypothetical protein
MVDLVRTVHFYSEGSCAAVVRLPTHGHEWIAWALDAGAAGIILPHVSSHWTGQRYACLLTSLVIPSPRLLSRPRQSLKRLVSAPLASGRSRRSRSFRVPTMRRQRERPSLTCGTTTLSLSCRSNLRSVSRTPQRLLPRPAVGYLLEVTACVGPNSSCFFS